MRLKALNALSVLVLAGLCMLSFAPSTLAQSENWRSDGNLLEGTWIVQVTQQDCQSGAALGAPFLSLLTFARGGTMTETTSNPMFAPPIARGPGHGVWGATGHRTYSASSIAFITVSGVLAKTQVITQTIKFGTSPDNFATTAATVQFFNPAGSLVMAGCAAATGKRFQ